MRSKNRSLVLTAVLAMFVMTTFVAGTRAAAQTENVLFSFTGSGEHGSSPVGGLIFDAAGNLYGTTMVGGAGVCGSEGCGTAFELMSTVGGGWTQKVLHSFHDDGKDGWYPVTSLIFDAAGNLYGTTENGGSHAAGTVFELTLTASGGWTEKLLHNFGLGTDGAAPEAALIFDAAGNLYGTTASGGTHLSGTVFELSPTASGGWTEKLLHSFAGYPKDGSDPVASLIFDAAGNLYGTTAAGGKYSVCPDGASCGTVFEMTPTADGGWTEKVLYDFKDTLDGNTPGGSLIFDAAGNLFGTTEIGGNITSCNGIAGYGCGTVFELTPSADGKWTEMVLHDFGSGTDGFYPGNSRLIFDAGNLYGTTTSGGIFSHSGGTVFEMTPTAGGGWTESLLHSFGDGTDGSYPDGGLIFDSLGNLYGTTFHGGGGVCTGYSGGPVVGCGAVFEIAP
jgi:uncharacterized repeat protein (TIGR03803 family)